MAAGLVGGVRGSGGGSLARRRRAAAVLPCALLLVLVLPSDLIESISNGGTPLVASAMAYADVRDGNGLTKRTETDARGYATVRTEDALHREVETKDAQSHSTEVRRR